MKVSEKGRIMGLDTAVGFKSERITENVQEEKEKEMVVRVE